MTGGKAVKPDGPDQFLPAFKRNSPADAALIPEPLMKMIYYFPDIAHFVQRNGRKIFCNPFIRKEVKQIRLVRMLDFNEVEAGAMQNRESI
jgi:hypothetical protein